MNLMVLLRKLYDELIDFDKNEFFAVLQTFLTQMITILLSILKLPRMRPEFCK